MTRSAVVLPHRTWWESHCPACESLQTEYHPGERWGRCYGCGFTWSFLPYTKRIDPVPGIDAPPSPTPSLPHERMRR